MRCFVCNEMLFTFTVKCVEQYDVVMLCCRCINMLLGTEPCRGGKISVNNCRDVCNHPDCFNHLVAQKLAKIGLDKVPNDVILSTYKNTDNLATSVRVLFAFLYILKILLRNC